MLQNQCAKVKELPDQDQNWIEDRSALTLFLFIKFSFGGGRGGEGRGREVSSFCRISHHDLRLCPTLRGSNFPAVRQA